MEAWQGETWKRWLSAWKKRWIQTTSGTVWGKSHISLNVFAPKASPFSISPVGMPCSWTQQRCCRTFFPKNSLRMLWHASFISSQGFELSRLGLCSLGVTR